MLDRFLGAKQSPSTVLNSKVIEDLADIKVTFGQYFTPLEICNFMVDLISKKTDAQILEPSAGEGVFISALLKKGFNSITAYEIDPALNSSIKGFKINRCDFLQSDPDSKYDVIIGNPPYVHWNNILESTRSFLLNHPFWRNYVNGEWDLLYPFIIWSIEKLKPSGELIFIVPYFWFNSTHAYSLRQYVMEHGYFETIIHFGELKLFKDAYPNSIIFKYIKNSPFSIDNRKDYKVIEYMRRTGEISQILQKIYAIYQNFPENSETRKDFSIFYMNQFDNAFMWALIPPQTKKNLDLVEYNATINIPSITLTKYGNLPITNLFSTKDLKIFNISNVSTKKIRAFNSTYHILQSKPDQAIHGNFLRLKHICKVGVGMVTGLDEAFELNEEELLNLNSNEQKKLIPFVKAKNIRRYYVERPALFIWLDDVKEEKDILQKYPHFYQKLIQYKEKLEQRFEYKEVKWFHHSVSRNLQLFQEMLYSEKLFVPALDRAKISRFAFTDQPYYGGSDCIVIVKQNQILIKENIRYLLAWLNSTFINQWYRIKGPHRGERIQYSQSALEEIPMRLINWTDIDEINIHNDICNYIDAIIQNADIESQYRQIIDEKIELLLKKAN